MSLFNTGTLGIIDLTKPVSEPQYYICDKNRKRQSKVSVAVNKTLSAKFGNNNELNLQIPYLINNKINPSLQYIMPNNLIEIVYNGQSSYYIISQEKNIYDSSEEIDYKQITCFSNVYELTYTSVPTDYSVSAYSLKEILLGKSFETDGILKNTDWSIGYVSNAISVKYRSISLSGTILEAITDIAKVFNAIINWDEINKKINFYDIYDANINVDKGLIFTANKYLSAIEQDKFFDEIKTQMTVTGKNGLTLGLVTSDGSSSLKDYSFYMQGFKMDSNGNVISSSIFNMSDDLCKAITNYNKLLSQNSGKLSNLLNQKINLLSIIDIKNAELSNLQTDLTNLRLQQNALQSSNLSFSDITEKKNEKQAQYDTKQKEINLLENQLQNLINDIKNLQSLLSETNNFTPSLLREKQGFTRTREYKNENYDVDTELYQAAEDEFKQYTQPQITYSLDIMNFLSCIETQYDWNKLELGDIITIKYDLFDIYIKARVIQIDYDFDNYTIKLTISNVKDVINNVQKFINVLYQGVSSGSTIDTVEKRVRDLNDDITTFKNILNSAWDAGKQNITAANDTVQINQTGFTTHESGNSNRMIRIANGSVMVSSVGEDGLHPIINADGLITNNSSSTGNSFGSFDIKSTVNEIVGNSNVGFQILNTNNIQLLYQDKNGILNFNGQINTVNGSKPQITSYYDSNGGFFKLYDVDGQDTIMMTCNQENNTPATGTDYTYNVNGGKLLIYNNKKLSSGTDELSLHQRLEFGSKEYVNTTDATKNNDFGYIYVKNSNAKNVVKIQGSNSSEKCGIITLNNEDEISKLIVRSYDQTNNLGVLDTSMNNGGGLELRSYDGTVRYYLKVNNSNCLIIHDTTGNLIEFNPEIDKLTLYHHSGSYFHVGNDIEAHSNGIINFN